MKRFQLNGRKYFNACICDDDDDGDDGSSGDDDDYEELTQNLNELPNESKQTSSVDS